MSDIPESPLPTTDPNPIPGSQVAPDSTETPTAPVPPTDIPAQPKPKASKTWLLLLVVVVLAGAGVGAYLLRSSTKPAVVAKQDIPVLNYGLSDSTFTQTYPLGSSSTSLMTQVNAQLFEGLVRYQQETKIVPLLASSWSNPDDTTWVFNLRHGVKFHSGRGLTAQDVKYSLDYAVAHQSDENATAALALASTIKEVDLVPGNDYQVKIVTDGPDPTLLNRLAELYVFDSKATLGDPDAGTGPYVLKPGTKPTANTMDLSAISNYWGGHVYTKAVDITTVSDTSKLGSETAQGKFDLAGDLPDSQLAKINDSRILNVEDLGVSFLGLNTMKTGSPLQSLPVRQAAAYALNIPAILKAGGIRGQQASQLVPSAILGHDPSIKNTPYDPAKARQLLASVNGSNTPLTLSYASGDDKQVAEIAKELNAVGFNVKLSQQPDIGTLIGIALGGQTDMFYASYTSDILDGLDIVSSIVIGNKDYDNAQVDSLANQASSTLDSSTRIKLLQQIARQVAKDMPDIPLYAQTRSYALMKPYHVQVDIPSTEAGVYFWQVYQ